MNLIENIKIAIVGGGPGGLTLAKLLQLKGALVTVYERDLNKEVRVQGATLDLHEDSGLKALEHAGLMEAFQRNYRPGADRTRITDKHARILMDEDGEAKWGRPEIDRGPLRKILLDSLRPETVVWDSFFTGMTPDGKGWQLEFKNGSAAFADLVIAADGANSRIRPFITPLKSFYSGVTVLEGVVYNSVVTAPDIHELVNGGKVFTMADERSLVVSSKGDGSIVFYAGFNAGENWINETGSRLKKKNDVISWYKDFFPGWSSTWLELLENSEYPLIIRPQYCMPLDQSWEPLSNLTMLGDAAHLMPPYAGEGVNMAMLDALELSECLTNDTLPDIRTAIEVYEKEMNKRFSEVGKITMEQTASFHSPTALADMLKMFTGDGTT